ncbi:MAG: hypothetical protein NVSMB26_23240 [Beijerinckiaceae bacterium]
MKRQNRGARRRRASLAAGAVLPAIVLRSIVLAGIVLGSIAAVMIAPALAQKSDEAAEARAVGDAMNTFYKAARKPDIGTLIARWERLGSSDQPAALPPMIGFLAAYFQRNPDQIDRISRHSLGRKGEIVMLLALEASGNKTATHRVAAKWRWKDEDIAKLASVKPLDQLVASSPSDLDTLWGASFATGDPAYVRKIYDFYARTANSPKIDLGDIVRVVEARRDNKPDSLRGIGERYPAEVARDIVFAASALWSLISNAALHPFVKAEIDGIEKDAGDTNAVKAMVALRQPR